MIKMFKSDKGFTMPEMLISSAVLATAILSTTFSILNLSDMSELSREKIVAMADANRVIEAMRDTANTSMTTLRTTDWDAWHQANVENQKGVNELLLTNEQVVTAISAADPAQVTLTLSWQHKRRTYQYQVITLITDRN